MKKVKSFLKIFLNSLLPDVAYYHKILNISFFQSFKYLSVLILVLNSIFTLSLTIRFNPCTVRDVLSGVITSIDKFPNNLAIFINKGNLLTTYDRPYFFWLDYDSKKKLLFVVDKNARPDKINQYGSKVLLTSNLMVISDFQKQLIAPLQKISDQTINKKNTLPYLKNILLKVQDWFPVLYVLFVLAAFVVFSLVSLVTVVFYLILASLTNLILFRFKILKHVTLKKILQISFYAVTLPLTLDYLLMIFKIKPIPILFFILMMVFVFCGIYEAYLDPERKIFIHPHHPHKH